MLSIDSIVLSRFQHKNVTGRFLHRITPRASKRVVKKRARLNPTASISTANASAAEILAALEQDDSLQQASVDEVTIKRISQQLQKKCDKNREQRIKYSEEPQKFMESEVELNNAIQPDLYPLVVENGVIQILLQLLSHENTDIVATVLNLIQTSKSCMKARRGQFLIDELLKCQIVETIVQQAITRLNEEVQDESDAVHNALTITLFPWLLARATKKSSFDANKLFSSQLLHMLLQSNENARKKLTDKIDGIELLLRALASYKRHDPSSPDEFEHMENLFDALCASLLHLPIVRYFWMVSEGLQLMNLILREKKQSREGALKVLSHATSIPDGGANCNKFVEILGLHEHEEHCCSVIDALLFLCDEQNRQRVAQKFEDHGCEKIDRAIELFIKYTGRVQKFSAKLAKNTTLADLEPDEIYIEKLGNGLYTLQRVTLIIAEVCVNGPTVCRERAAKIFRMKMKNPSLSDHLEPILREFHANLGDDADIQKQRVESLIIKISEISSDV
uniref:Beta-catenin-like protein 1 n=1 Tax=Ditylenchus dipsaci TaxID=166011 RepID=A0A915CXN4_9BILA